MRKGIVLLPFAFALAAAAQQMPNFSGKWVLDSSRSNVGKTERVDEIEHKDPILEQSIAARVEGSEHTSKLSYTTDGRENANALPGGKLMKSRSHWDGKRLVIEARVEQAAGDVASREVWELSASQRVLTVTRVLRTPRQTISNKLVFNKK